MGIPVGIVQGEVEGRATNQRGKGRNNDAFGQRRVKFLEQCWHHLLQKLMANLHGVAADRIRGVGLREHIAEILQSLEADIIGHRRGPNPLYAQRGFTPPFGPGAIGLLDRDADAGADHARHRLMAKL